jgi:hypothetical protein
MVLPPAKKLTKARSHRSLCLTIPCMKQDADGMPRDKDTHTRIRTRLCLHPLTGVGVDIQSEGTDMTINRLHSARYANSSLFGSVTHMLSRETLVFALRLDGNMLRISMLSIGKNILSRVRCRWYYHARLGTITIENDESRCVYLHWSGLSALTYARATSLTSIVTCTQHFETARNNLIGDNRTTTIRFIFEQR